jgi:hypothetical protein
MMKIWQPSPEEINVTKNWGTWNKEASEFTWFYDETETCYILMGEAIATDDTGNSIHFKTGDMVQFEKGHECKWKIIQDIKKKYKFG